MDTRIRAFSLFPILQTDLQPVERTCYSAVRHVDGDVIQVRDCVLVKSGAKRTDIPFVAKIAALWEVKGEIYIQISRLGGLGARWGGGRYYK